MLPSSQSRPWGSSRLSQVPFSPVAAQDAPTLRKTIPAGEQPVELIPNQDAIQPGANQPKKPAVAPAPAPPKPSPQDGVVSRLIARLMPSEACLGQGTQRRNSAPEPGDLRRSLRSAETVLSAKRRRSVPEIRRRLDDHVRAGNLDLAYYIFNVFTQRVDQRVETIRELAQNRFRL